VNQPFQEIYKDTGGNPTLDKHKSHGTLWRDGRDHIASETGSGRVNHGGFATNRPRFTRMEVGTHPRLITKENIRLLLSRQSTNLWVFLINPFLNALGILLKSSPKRLLRAKTKLIQQPAYRCFAEANAELTPNQFSYHEARPQRKRKLHLSGVFHRHSVINPFQHLGCQFRWTPTTLASVQGIPSSTAISGQPAEQGRPLHTKHLRHQLWRLPILNRGYSPLSQFRKFIMRKPSCIVFPHASIITL